MYAQELIKEIETYRNKMISLAFQSSFSNQEVVHISQKLDDLLNQYHSLHQKK